MTTVNIQKFLTYEYKGSVSLSSNDCIDVLRYALTRVCFLSEEEILRIFCVKFLEKHHLIRFFKGIDCPGALQAFRIEYVKSKICPNVYQLDEEYYVRKAYLNLLKRSGEKFFTRYKHIGHVRQIIRFMCSLMFEKVDDPKELLDFAFCHPKEMETLIFQFELDDFYLEFCSHPLNFIFYGLTDMEQKQNLAYFLELEAKLQCPEREVLSLIQRIPEEICG